MIAVCIWVVESNTNPPWVTSSKFELPETVNIYSSQLLPFIQENFAQKYSYLYKTEPETLPSHHSW